MSLLSASPRKGSLVPCMIMVGVTLLLCAAPAPAQDAPPPGSCDFSDVPGIVWWGTDEQLTIKRFASYMAPVFWHSPDEPELERKRGEEIMVPEVLPFQEAEGPVVYFQLTELFSRPGGEARVFTPDEQDPDESLVDMSLVALGRLEFYAYYSDEVGLGAHKHDIEPVEFKFGVARSDGDWARENGLLGRCAERNHLLMVARVTGKAHGIEWFWNIVEVDDETNFPMYMFVEEGKHALGTDKNSDGYFTPSYDVNVRVNDAWGVRDIIRSGGLFSGGYEAWMTKVRRPEHRVLPPLPDDSPLRPEGLQRQPNYTGGNATYELRTLPLAEEVMAWDETQRSEPDFHALYPFVASKEVEGGPQIEALDTTEQVTDWLTSGIAKKSLSIALYSDGNLGVSWMFPFFVVKHLTIPMSGGYLLHRMYLTGDQLQDFGWMGLYTNSASRWVDPYFAAGVEWHTVTDDEGVEDRRTDFVLETGLKFRAQIGSSPLKFLSFFTDFWGFRAGIKNYGFFDIDQLTYVLEVGAGSF